MLGMIYTEFLDMVEDKFGAETADNMVESVVQRLESGASYTAFGNYSHTEIVQLVVSLSKITDLPIEQLVRVFGSHLFHRFGELYPDLVGKNGDTLDFLEGVESHIHRQVRMLYPEANLPSFVCERLNADELIMEYRSERAFSELAHGLILGCADHFGQKVTVTFEPLEGEPPGVRFQVVRND